MTVTVLFVCTLPSRYPHLTSAQIRSPDDHLRTNTNSGSYVMLVVQLEWLEISPICVHSRVLARWPPPYFTFQQVASSPRQCQDAACLAAPNTAFACIASHLYYSPVSTVQPSPPLRILGKLDICVVFVLITCGQISNCILSSLDD